ncbi:MAG: glycosyltransferase family 2 protein [Acidilobus sp.]
MACVLMPSYERPSIVRLTLNSWVNAKDVGKVIVVAESSSREGLKLYEEYLSEFGSKVHYVLNLGKLGSVNARNLLLKMALEAGCSHALMVDDDYILPMSSFVKIMIRYLEEMPEVGAVGGRVVVTRRRAVDPDFFLNAPVPVADALSRATGYVFLDVKNGPRFAEYLPPFFMIRGELLGKVWYSHEFEAPTGFREESDIQEQIKRLGYRLLLEPRVFVYHLAIEEGGNRPKINMTVRMYWKSRNNTRFISKWTRSPLLKSWYLLTSTLLLATYRPQHLLAILKGMRDGSR